jgi:hypothetical protein
VASRPTPLPAGAQRLTGGHSGGIGDSSADKVLPHASDGVAVRFTDDRLNRLLGHLQREEQRVLLAYGDGICLARESLTDATCPDAGQPDERASAATPSYPTDSAHPSDAFFCR